MASVAAVWRQQGEGQFVQGHCHRTARLVLDDGHRPSVSHRLDVAPPEPLNVTQPEARHASFEDGTTVMTVTQEAAASAPAVVYEFEPVESETFSCEERSFNYTFTATESPLSAGSITINTAQLPEWITVDNADALAFSISYNDSGSDRSATISVTYTAPDATTITKDLVINQSMGLF